MKINSWNLSVSEKLNYLIIFIFLFIATLFISIVLRHERNTYSQELNNQAEIIFKSIAHSVRFGIINENKHILKEILDDAVKNDNITYAHIENIKNNVIALSGNRQTKGTKEFSFAVNNYKVKSDSKTKSKVPSLITNNEAIGNIVIGFSNTNLIKKQRHAVFLIIFTGLVVLVFLTSLIYFTIRFFLTSRINYVLSELVKFGNGDLSRRISIHSGDELEDFSLAFNSMADKLSKTVISKNYFDSIFASMMNTLIVTDPEGNVVTANKASLKLLGYTETELTGKHFSTILSVQSNISKDIFTDLMQESHISNIEKVYFSKSGKHIPVIFSSSIIRDSEGNILNILCGAQDISELNEALLAIAVGKKRLDVILANIKDGVIAVDTQGNTIFMNNAAEKVTGWKNRETNGKPLVDFFNTSDNEKNNWLNIISPESILVLKNAHTCKSNIISKDGSQKLITINATPVSSDSDSTIGIIIVFQDITDKNKIDEHQLKTAKLESIGILAGGIAHDFNNILTVLIGNLSLAKLSIDKESEVYPLMIEMETASFRARDLNQKLLLYSKGEQPVKKTASVIDLLLNSTDFVLSGSKINKELSIPDDLWQIDYNEGQLNQVFNHLIINATQAMSNGGTIKVIASNILINSTTKLPLDPGKYIKVSIYDTGTGIPPEIISKIFAPYFTTKTTGTGLGLSTCYSIVKKHLGHIEVDSSLGEGTVFHVYLPASSKVNV